MKEEIKEILDNLNYTAKRHTIQVLENGEKIEHCPQEIATELRLNTYSANILLDYITNLQEENERLKQPQIFIDTMDMEERYGQELYEDYLKEQLEDYKQRNEKALAKINNMFDLGNENTIIDDLLQLENILKGDKDV